MRAAPNARSHGKIQFHYQNGQTAAAAYSGEIDFYEPISHHFAAVWDHLGAGPDKGIMHVYFNGIALGSTELAHADIAPEQTNPFQIGSSANPPRVALDEVRLTAAALTPFEFLSGSPAIKAVFWLDSTRPATWSHLTPQDPDRVPAIGSGLNGLPTLSFDGNDFLAGPPVLREGADSFTFIVLWKPGRTRVQTIFEQAGLGNGRRAALFQFFGKFGFNGEKNDAYELAPATPENEWHLTAMVVNGEENNNVMVMDNGAVPKIASIDVELLNLGIDGIRVGRKLHGAEYFHGEIAEIRVFDAALSNEGLGRQLLGFQKRWGLEQPETKGPGSDETIEF
jgi:hypothetical protein